MGLLSYHTTCTHTLAPSLSHQVLAQPGTPTLEKKKRRHIPNTSTTTQRRPYRLNGIKPNQLIYIMHLSIIQLFDPSPIQPKEVAEPTET